MAAHGALLACLLFLLPDGRPDTGSAVAGVEVMLLSVVSSDTTQTQSVIAKKDVPAVQQAPVRRVLEARPEETMSTSIQLADEFKKPIINNPLESEAENEAEVASQIEKADSPVSKTVATTQSGIQRSPDASSNNSVAVDAEKVRNHAVRQRLEDFKHYPASARRRGIEGAVDVSFRLNASGQAEDMQLLSGSGYSILDDAALSTVRRAEPFPVHGGSYRFRLLFSRS